VPQNVFLNDGARARFAGGIRPIDARIGLAPSPPSAASASPTSSR
jgi:hypothetical protein